MRMKNVEDMPIEHWMSVETMEQIQMVLDYNENDVDATFELFLYALGLCEHPIYKGKDKIEMRKKLNKKFNLNCLNFNDVKIGEKLIILLYCIETGDNIYNIKSKIDYNINIDLNQCILPYIKYKSDCFNELIKWFRNQTIQSTNNVFTNIPYDKLGDLVKYIDPNSIKSPNKTHSYKHVENINIMFNNIRIDYGTGGFHFGTQGITETNNDRIIFDIDVASLYPSISVQYGFYPKHLGEIFTKVYGDNIVNVRLAEKAKPKKERDMVIMEGYKLAANGSYGKSGEISSVLFDPSFTMSITLNGQLLLTQLVENIILNTQDTDIQQVNTDGATFLIKRSEHEKCLQICKNWEKETGLILEYTYYKKLIMRDVNNFIAEYQESTPENPILKLKGCFEIDTELHKNSSMKIVPIALKEYYINNIPIEETIRNHTDIFDFCLATRLKKGWELNYIYIDGEVKTKKLTRTLRYFASTSGGVLQKSSESSTISINVKQKVTLFNKYYDVNNFSEYNIDYQFYINECNKIINAVQPKQQKSLFDE